MAKYKKTGPTVSGFTKEELKKVRRNIEDKDVKSLCLEFDISPLYLKHTLYGVYAYQSTSKIITAAMEIATRNIALKEQQNEKAEQIREQFNKL